MTTPDLLLTMPVPPSTNRLWRFGGGRKPYLSPEYAEWKKTAGWLARTQLIQWGKLAGHFRVRLEVPLTHRDPGNFEKPLLDLAQAIGAIENDKLATGGIEIVPNPDRTDCLLLFWKTATVEVPRQTRKPRRKPVSRPTAAQVARAERLRMLPR